MKKLINDLNNKSLNIANYLSQYLSTHNSFKLRTFYGESFALNLLYRHKILDEKNKNILINQYLKKDKSDPEFHFEFNNYAFSDLFKRSEDAQYRELYLPLKFKGTKCTNWTLLRSNVRLIENVDVILAREEFRSKINNYQLSSGLILDDVGVKSFQYHCFSMAMLLEIYEISMDAEALNSFISGVKFIRNFILKNGDALYIGRGQEQSFGLGVLIYILSKFYSLTKDQDVLFDIKLVLEFISKFQYSNGSFPLVFTGKENPIPQNVDMNSVEFSGWYPYNNFFDYLPFLGFFLHKAFECLNQEEVLVLKSENMQKSTQHNFKDNSFIKVNKDKYSAVLSLPGGYWTNDLPMPLILYKGNFITPMLGGEQFQKSLYSLEALSMPTTRKGNRSWRKLGRGLFIGNNLIWVSLFGVMLRRYKFYDNNIIIKNYTFSWIKSFQNFSFLSTCKLTSDAQLISDSYIVKFNSKIHSQQNGYSAMGDLKVIKTSMNIEINLELI
ncbi:MAG: hypothetical protein Q7U04_10795 [Bacteriovorax sp.]|nr:hypothetical protein [Bacteriovorax sp.]